MDDRPSAGKAAAGHAVVVSTGHDPADAARRLLAAAERGFPDAQLVLAQLYLDGHGVAADPAAAFRWFSRAADHGRSEAVNMVGRCHELGWGVPADPAMAAQWYRRAARMGHAWAQFNLAGLLLDGQGVPQDARGALSLYVRAARRGHAKAMTMIGRFQEEGWERRPDRAAAFRWYRRGADGGDFRGHFNLGRLLMQQGQTAEAIGRLERAVEAATPVFCRDVAGGFLRHPEEAVRVLGRRCLARACETRAAADIERYASLLAQGEIRFADAAAPAEPVAHRPGSSRPRSLAGFSFTRRLSALWRR
ncbi:MAG: tetratricopeptide repeat protein [Pseudochelatococcus sp.]|jgi:TPR repeat protein|uniref:tetratricopeptide repeat protein n=1 Tax=Pseudochelatococcus sp. TaxID=2020869 RepID=UPI003D8FC103